MNESINMAAKSLDKAVKSIIESNNFKPRNEEVKDLAESLSVQIKLTREFHMLITENFDDLDPDPTHFRKIYFDTQTLGYVLMDRLIALEDEAEKLVDILYNS